MSSTALIGTRKGLFAVSTTDDGFSISEPAFLGARVVNAVSDPRDGAWYASLDHGHFGTHLFRSDDEGVNWVEIGAPTYPPKPAGVVHLNPMSQKEIEWTTQLAWVIAAGHHDEPGVMWCGTVPGGLFRSEDRGDSWALVESLWNIPARDKWFGGGFDDPGIHSISIDPRGPGRLIVGLSCGGAWRTDDGGSTWTVAARGMRANFVPPELEYDPDMQDPHMIVRCAASPDVLWTQNHCGIFKSVDDGDSWTEIAPTGDAGVPSTFGFATAVHPHDPDTAWFVPAIDDEVRVPVDGRFVVTRTRDGGATFDVLTDGLPAHDAYDLVFRHALDIDATGDQLVMGSTTGSLWWTRNGGDEWELVTANLPPIASVRLA